MDFVEPPDGVLHDGVNDGDTCEEFIADETRNWKFLSGKNRFNTFCLAIAFCIDSRIFGRSTSFLWCVQMVIYILS